LLYNFSDDNLLSQVVGQDLQRCAGKQNLSKACSLDGLQQSVKLLLHDIPLTHCLLETWSMFQSLVHDWLRRALESQSYRQSNFTSVAVCEITGDALLVCEPPSADLPKFGLLMFQQLAQS
jgi:hypothetical protein